MPRTNEISRIGITVLFALIAVVSYGKDFALAVGVWDYQDATLKLEAPENDLVLIRSVFESRGFKGDALRILPNPTKAEMVAAMKQTGQKLGANDRFFFYFSGHGAQIIDAFGRGAGDEVNSAYPDRNDEALLLRDVELSSPETYLLDDEINELLQAYPTRQITCIIDTCYSGDILKQMRLGKPKGVVSQADARREPSRSDDILDSASEFAVLIAAAPYHQTVHELRVPIKREYLPVSAMTYSLYRQSMRLPSMTYRQLARLIETDHREWNLPWSPALEGNKARFDESFPELGASPDHDSLVAMTMESGNVRGLSHHELGSLGGSDSRLGRGRGTAPQRWAIVIGVDDYPEPYASLRYAADDAKAMKDSLERAGFAVTLMTPDGLIQPTKANILRQIEWHARLDRIDLLTVYLSGHGEDEDGESFFVPMDTAEPLSDTGLRLDDLFGALEKTNAEHRFVIVDACRVAPQQQFTATLSKYAEETNIIFTACDRDQYAPEVPELGHGLFTHFLLKGLDEDATGSPRAAADDGTVTVLSLLDYTAREIKAWQRTASGGQISEPITPRVFYSGRSIELISGSRVYSPQQTRGDRPPQTDATTPKTYDQPLFSFSVMDDIGVGTRPDSAPRFSFNIISGRHSGLDGLEVGYGINRETDFARGVQIAGIANGVEGRVEAAQIAGIANIAGADADAAQISGVANYTHGSLRGVQVGGVVNVVEGGAEAVQSAGVVNVTRGATRSVQGAGVGNVSGALEGVQSSGVFNHVIGDAQAVQIAGVVNSVYGNLDGIQISGVVNVAEDVEGIQIGLVNVGRSVNGIQIGLVNVSDEMVGLPIGLWTHVNKNGRRKVEIASNDLFPGNVSIKTGTEHFYSILTAGLNRSSDPYRWGVGGGFGGRIPVEPFYIAIEATFIKINEDELWTDKHHAVNRLQVMGGWDVTPRLTLVAGVALNLFVSQLNDGEGLVDWRPDFGTFYKSKHDDTWLRMWPGVIFGVQF